MRPVSKIAAGFLAVVVAASSTQAALLVSDSFPTDGNLAGTTPAVGGAWNAHSGAGLTPIQVSGGTVSLLQGSGSREDDSVPFDGGFAAGAGVVLYSSFDLTVPDPGAAITPVYFAHFLQGTSSFVSRLWVTTPASSGYQLALSNGSSLTPSSGSAAFSGDLQFGHTYKVVTSYDYTNMTGTLWIDPTGASSPSVAATDTGFSDAVVAYAFRQAGGNTIETIDNLKVGTSFADVVTPAPEPASLGLLGLGAVGLIRRRRVSR